MDTYTLGFSTGVLRDDMTPKQALKFTRELGCSAAELGYIRFERMTDGTIEELGPNDFDGFDFVSIHAPKVTYGKNQDTELVLEKIKHIHSIHPLDVVVIHPDIVEDFTVLQSTGLPIALENMDNRKAAFQTAKELDNLTKQYGFNKFVLDLNHIYTNDPTMNMTKEFYNLLGDRIVEIQVSGYIELHDPLVLSKQKEILTAVKDNHIPIINEGGKMSPDLVKRELEYMLENLK